MATSPAPSEMLIIDDHPLFRSAIAALLDRLGDGMRLIELSSCEEALAWLRDRPDPALILLDLSLPGMDGMSGLDPLREASPATPIVVLSATEQTERIKQAMTRGAMGYIPKSAPGDVILNAIRLVLAGGVYLPENVLAPKPHDPSPHATAGNTRLTARQHEVLELLCHGLSNKDIASQLHLAENTVRVHVAAILRLLGVKNRTEAGYRARSLGLVRG